MEDLAANEFTEGFLEAIKVLEDFSASDEQLRDALRELRSRVDAKKYSCAPDFWNDLRSTLAAVEQGDGRTKPSKAQQVMKHIDRLEVKFWAKENVGMLRDMEPDMRLDRMVDWVQTFHADDASSGPAVLFLVLKDLTLQKDMKPEERDTLIATVHENLHKFPVEMQETLKRVNMLQPSGSRTVADWRRRSLATTSQDVQSLLAQQRSDQAPTTLGTSVGSTAPGRSASATLEESIAARLHEIGGAGVAGGLRYKAQGGKAELDEGEEAAAPEPFDLAAVSPEVLQKAKQVVLGMLNASGGECPKQFIRSSLRELGVAGMPLSAFGDEVFSSATEVFLRRAGSSAVPPAQAPGAQPLPDEIKQQIVTLVQEAGGRMLIRQLMEKMQWHPGSLRHGMHGPLRKVLPHVQELFFEPDKVLSNVQARRHIAVLGGGPEDNPEEVAEAEPAGAEVASYVDPYVELITSIRAWLEQGQGALRQDFVLPLVQAMGFKVSAVIRTLSNEVFWSHREAECEILLRSAVGAAMHPRPLPEVYLDPTVRETLIREVKDMGAKAKVDKLAGNMRWNKNSKLRQTCGSLFVVLQGVREIFFDPTYLYLKRSLDGIVQWPVTKDGRLGPKERPVVQWSREVDDMKAAGNPEWLNFKRRLFGTLLTSGGTCEVDTVRQWLGQLNDELKLEEGNEVTIESLFLPGSEHDLSKALVFKEDEGCVSLHHTAQSAEPTEPEGGEGGGVQEAQQPRDDVALSIPATANLEDGEVFIALVKGMDDAGGEPAVDPAPSPSQTEEQAAEPSPEFFTFDSFSAAAAEVGPPPPKRMRQDAGPGANGQTLAWEEEAMCPSWATEGAAVVVRSDPPTAASQQEIGIIVRARGLACLVRLGVASQKTGLAGGGLIVEQEIATERLVPLAPEIGNTVKVIDGPRCGCYGTLTGVAGGDGIVQIGRMSYETMPVRNLVVVAS